MLDFFFFGSLRHIPLLEIVLGRDVAGSDVHADCLANAEIRWAGADPFPLILRGQGDGAPGVRVANISADEAARLDFFEGDDEYDLAQVTLASGHSAQCYVAGPKLGSAGPLWSFEDWRNDWAEFSCLAAQEYMALFGQMPEARADAMWPAIQKRAWSRLQAAKSDAAARAYTVLDQRRPYQGFFALDELDVTHTKFDGTISDPMSRAVFVGMDAAFVLPYDPMRDCVLLVEQFRCGPLARGAGQCWQMEPVAGLIDPGETPKQTARRECVEEAAVTLQDLHPVGEYYPSPGASTEYFHIFIGIADLPDSVVGVHGLASEGEDIRTHILFFDAFMDMLDTGKGGNASLAVAGYWLARHRDRLRNA